MDGRRGLAVQLLIDDALNQRLKRRLRAGQAQREWPGASDQAGKFGIGGGEFAAGEGKVVAGRVRAWARTGHPSTVSQPGTKCLLPLLRKLTASRMALLRPIIG